MKKAFTILLILIISKANAQWTQVGLQAYRINKLLFIDSLIYAGSETSGVFKSGNGGANWTNVSNGISGTQRITGLAASPPGVFATTEDTIYFTDNDGANWSAVHAMETGGNSEVYWNLSENGGVLFAQIQDNGGIDRISRSADGGNIWTSMAGFGASAFDDSYAYFCDNSNVYRSSDNGSTTILQPNAGLIDGIVYSAAAYGSALLYIGLLEINTAKKYVQRSVDHAASWQTIDSLSNNGILIARGNLVAHAGAYSLRLSGDAGNTWVSLTSPGGHFDHLKFYDNYLYAATHTGIYKLDVSQYSGLQEAENADQGSMTFPNPFSNQLTFSLANNVQTTISLYNFLGQQVLQQSFTNSTAINTAQLADGIYFYELRNDKGKVKNGKVIKQTSR